MSETAAIIAVSSELGRMRGSQLHIHGNRLVNQSLVETYVDIRDFIRALFTRSDQDRAYEITISRSLSGSGISINITQRSAEMPPEFNHIIRSLEAALNDPRFSFLQKIESIGGYSFTVDITEIPLNIVIVQSIILYAHVAFIVPNYLENMIKIMTGETIKPNNININYNDLINESYKTEYNSILNIVKKSMTSTNDLVLPEKGKNIKIPMSMEYMNFSEETNDDKIKEIIKEFK